MWRETRIVNSHDTGDRTAETIADAKIVVVEGVRFLLINIRSIKNPTNLAKLSVQLKETEPDLIFVTETWLDSSVEEVFLPGYHSIGRRDRGEQKKGGGVDIFARDGFRDVGLLAKSETSERSWATLHTKVGPILLGAWYRPPDEPEAELQMLESELELHQPGHVGTFVFCDANVHHKRWLKYSESNTSLGQRLKDICDGAGLQQVVREPTRKGNLLDLVLTTMGDNSKVSVLQSLTDYRPVLCETKLEVAKVTEVERVVWDFRKADWEGLRVHLKNEDWNTQSEQNENEATEFGNSRHGARTCTQTR